MSNKRRCAIFACHFANNLVPHYVFSYLMDLKNVAELLIVVGDHELSENEEEKLKIYADFVHFKKHDEYDFGSYKRGFFLFQKLDIFGKINELILCNDSCFKTTFSFKNMFKKMSRKKCDFWGIENATFPTHLQSYFLVFKQNVFTSSVFYNFLSNITALPKKAVVSNYEVPLLYFLEDANFKKGAFISLYNPHHHPLLLLKKKSPIIKKKNFILPFDSRDDLQEVLLFLKNNSLKTFYDILLYCQKSSIQDFNYLSSLPTKIISHKRHFIRIVKRIL